MVHQHFMLVDTFTVAENIILGKEPKSFAELTGSGSPKRSRTFPIDTAFRLILKQKLLTYQSACKERAEILKPSTAGLTF